MKDYLWKYKTSVRCWAN